MHSRIGVAVQTQEVDLGLGGSCRIAGLGGLQCALAVQRKTRAKGILVGVEEHVRPIIFVVTDSLAWFGPISGRHTLVRIGMAAIGGY